MKAYIRLLLLFFALLFIAKPADVFSQKAKIKWLQSTYGSSFYTTANVRKTAVDKDGNIYSSGFFSTGYDTVFFDKNNYFISESMDAFVVKYLANGNVAWARSFANIVRTGMSHQDWANSVAVDEQGNCYVTGNHNAPIKIGKDSIEGNGGFLVKLDSTGTIKWARSIGGSGGAGGSSMLVSKIDKSGNVIVAGSYDFFANSTQKLDTTTMHSYGDRDVYVAKFSPNGKLMWHITAGGQYEDYLADMTVDDNDNIYFSCHFSINPNLNKAALSNASWSIALIKLNKNGKVVNKNYFSLSNGTASLEYSPYENCLYILFGWYGYDLKLSTNKTITPKGLDLALAKFDTAFNYREAIHITDEKSMSGDLILDKDYNPIVFGLGNEAVILANGDTIANRSKQDRRMYISKFAKDLSFVWAEEIDNKYFGNSFDVASHPKSPYLSISGNYHNGMKYYKDSLYKNGVNVFTASMITNDNKGMILGTKYLCQGAVGNYYVKYEVGSKYEWTIKGGKIITTNSDTNDILLRWHSADNVYLALKQTYANNTVIYDTIRPNVIGINVSNILGDTIICPGRTRTYHAKFLNDNTYTWDISAGNFTTISPDSISLTWKDTGIYYVKLAIKSPIGCEDTVQLKVHVAKIKTLINGPQTICTNKTAIFSTKQLPHEKVAWKVSEGKPNGSNTNDTLEINWQTAGKKRITLIKTAGDCSDSTVFEVNVIDIPTVSISGDQLICRGKIAQYTANTNAQNLQWHVTGGNLLTGQNTDTIIVKWDDTSNAQLKVVASSGGSCSDSALLNINVIDTPQLNYDVINVCYGDSIHISNSSKIPSSHTFVWHFGDGGVSNAHQPSHLYAQPGKYKIKLFVSGACTDSFIKEVTVFPPTAKPVITLKGDTLISSPAASYQWFKDNSIISNSTSRTFIVKASGDYTVQVTDNNGCKNISSAYKFIAKDTLQGYITQSNTQALKNTKVYLLKIYYKDTTLQTADSAFTDNSGFYRFVLRDSLVYLMAAPDSINYPREIPTYFDSAIVFDFAKPIPIHPGVNIASWQTRSGVNTGGTGFISGKITTCVACKKDEEGEPVSQLKVFLVDNENKPVGFTYTDWEGRLRFTDIPVGKYKVWVDKFMIDNSKAPMVEITAGQHQLINLRFTLYPHYLALDSATDIQQVDPIKSILKIFPNPFTQSTDVQFNLYQSQKISIFLTDINGRQIIVTDELMKAGLNRVRIHRNEHKLVPGIYFLQLRTKDGLEVQKVILQ